MEENHNHMSITSNNLDKLITNILVSILISQIHLNLNLFMDKHAKFTHFSLHFRFGIQADHSYSNCVCLATSNSMHIIEG